MADQTVAIIDDQIKRTKLNEGQYKIEEIKDTKPGNTKDLAGSDGPVTIKGWLNPENQEASIHVNILDKSVGTIKVNFQYALRIEVDFQKTKGDVRFHPTGGPIQVIYGLYSMDGTKSEGQFLLQ